MKKIIEIIKQVQREHLKYTTEQVVYMLYLEFLKNEKNGVV